MLNTEGEDKQKVKYDLLIEIPRVAIHRSMFQHSNLIYIY